MVTGQVSHNQLSGAPMLLCSLLSSFHSLSTPPHVYTPISTRISIHIHPYIQEPMGTPNSQGQRPILSCHLSSQLGRYTCAQSHTHAQADHCTESIQMLPREPGRIRRGRSEDKREVTLSSRGPNKEQSRTPHAREADAEGDTAALPELPFQCPHRIFRPVPTAAEDKPHPLPSRYFLSAGRFHLPPQTQLTHSHWHHHLTPWSACLQPKQTRCCPDFKFLLLRPTRSVPALSSSTPERPASNPDTTPARHFLGRK